LKWRESASNIVILVENKIESLPTASYAIILGSCGCPKSEPITPNPIRSSNLIKVLLSSILSYGAMYSEKRLVSLSSP